MEQRYLPSAGLLTSRLALGTMMFGGQTGEQESLRIMDLALERGVNHFDTANVYNQGESERLVGKAIKGRRDKVVLATKVFGPMGDNPLDQGLGRRHILSEVEHSLKRLDTDHIDIYYLHAPDYNTPLEETLMTMDMLIRAGKIRYYGVSKFAAWQVADILRLCGQMGLAKPVIGQYVYNLLTRGIEGELLPFLKAHPMGLSIYNPIAAGLLSGKHTGGLPEAQTRFSFSQMYHDRYWTDENFAAVDKLKAISREYGMNLLQLALRWLASNPQVSTIICGVSKLEQLEQNVQALEEPALSAECLAACDAVWQGLAGTRLVYYR